MEFVLELLAELLLQICGEALVEIGFRGLGNMFTRSTNPWVGLIGFSVIGAVFGGASLLVFPESFVTTPELRLINLVASPVAAGALMAIVGSLTKRHGRRLRIESFGYGFVLAFALGLVRFFATR